VNPRLYRQFIASSIVLLITLVAFVWLLNPSGEAVSLPSPIESVFPLPGDTVVLQTAIEVDLPIGYELELEVDGVIIPRVEIGHTAATGRFIWQPGPAKLFEAWEGGDHSITIRWNRTAGGGPDQGTYSWRFRVV